MKVLSDGSGSIAYGYAGGDQIVCPESTFDYVQIMKHINETLQAAKLSEPGRAFLVVYTRDPTRTGYIPCETATAVFRDVFARHAEYAAANMPELLRKCPADCFVVEAK